MKERCYTVLGRTNTTSRYSIVVVYLFQSLLFASVGLSFPGTLVGIARVAARVRNLLML